MLIHNMVFIGVEYHTSAYHVVSCLCFSAHNEDTGLKKDNNEKDYQIIHNRLITYTKTSW